MGTTPYPNSKKQKFPPYLIQWYAVIQKLDGKVFCSVIMQSMSRVWIMIRVVR